MADAEMDERFSHVGKDPRFRRMKRKDRKFKVDKRFHGMFKDDKFKVKYTVDKRGRPIKLSSTDHLRKFYDLSDSEESDGSDEAENQPNSSKEAKSKTKNTGQKQDESPHHKALPAEKGKEQQHKQSKSSKDNLINSAKNQKVSKDEKSRGENLFITSSVKHKVSPHDEDCEDSTGGIGDESDSEDEDEQTGNGASEEEEDGYRGNRNQDACSDDEEESTSESDSDSVEPDLARGQGVPESSDDEVSDLEAEIEDESGIDHQWGELTRDAGEAQETTRRLAVCNMDWDRIKATDLLVLFTSFKPTGGIVHSVTIYPSEFGLQRMKEEDLKGPKELTENSEKEEKSLSSHGDKFHMEKLRQYQLKRMRYYYAVVDCDSPQTADHIYNECDGMEYETSASKIDLRFIPDDMTFAQEPKSIARDVPQLSTYKPSEFVSTALTQTKVDLTWDETDRDRVALTMRKFTKEDIESMDVKAYLASSSDEEGDPYAGIEEPDFGLSPSAEKAESLEGEEENEDDVLDKYKQLISEARQAQDRKEEKDTELEITWEPGLKQETEKLVKKASQSDSLTPWESYLQKRKLKQRQKRSEKRKAHQGGDSSEDEQAAVSDDELPAGIDLSDPYFKEELEKPETDSSKEQTKKKKRKGKKTNIETEDDEALKKDQAKLRLLMMDEDDNRQHFSLEAILEREKKKKKKKRKKKQEEEPQVEDTFQLNVQDPRFGDMYKNPLYNIDPTAPEFKKTKGSEALIQEKFKRRLKGDTHGKSRKPDGQTATKVARTEAPDVTVTTVDVAKLVKSVKNKTKLHQTKQGKRTKMR